MHCGKKWWIREFVAPYIFPLNPDYVAARSLRALRSKNYSAIARRKNIPFYPARTGMNFSYFQLARRSFRFPSQLICQGFFFQLAQILPEERVFCRAAPLGTPADYLDMFLSLGFMTIITKPTRITDQTVTLIDHIYTNTPEKLIKSGLCLADISLSLIHIWRCRRIERCRSRWSPYH